MQYTTFTRYVTFGIFKQTRRCSGQSGQWTDSGELSPAELLCRASLIRVITSRYKIAQATNLAVRVMSTDFLAGCCAGSVGIAAGYPLDTVKILMQTQAGGGARKYRSTLQTLQLVAREEGILRSVQCIEFLPS